jgi:hypothetical protein
LARKDCRRVGSPAQGNAGNIEVIANRSFAFVAMGTINKGALRNCRLTIREIGIEFEEGKFGREQKEKS